MEDRISKKILFYSPYGSWYPHTVWEITIAHALKIRGHKVDFVACDGVYPECDVHWAATAPRNEGSCNLCMRVSSHVYSSLKTPFQWIGRYINEEDRVKARSWADSLKGKEMFEAEYEGYPLGKWVKSSVHSHFRMNKLDLEDEKIVRAYRGYLYGAVLAVDAFKKVFDSFSPEILVMLNGRFFSHRVAMELAKERGIRVVVHERGRYDNTLSFFENEICHSKRQIAEIWGKWKDTPLIKEELCKIYEHLENRKRGKNTGWHPFNKDWEESLALKSRLGLPGDKKIVTLFTSSPDELAASEGWQEQIFSSQIEWINQTIGWFKKRPEYHLIIRMHPNIDGTTMGVNLQFLREVEGLISNLPSNVSIVMPKDEVNSYVLMELSIAGIVYLSTAGIEMATLGLPVLCAGKTYYYGFNFIHSLDKKENYIKLLERVVKTPKSNETRKLAYRFAYHYFFTLSIPMSKVDNINYRDAEIKYKSIDELGPGKDKDLDRIADFIISGKSLYPKPLGRDIDVLKKEEDNFFEELEKKGKLYDADNVASPHVSVIIPCYNYGRYLSDAVNSVLAQTYNDFEIIIVNDGSTDNSKEIAEQLIDAYPNHQIILINQENSGQPAYSRNRGISKARGKYILCLDADDMIAPTMLEECINLLGNDRSIAIAYTDRQDFDGVDQVVQAGNYDFSRLIYANHISYCAVFRKEVWMEVGGYRTNVKGCEDWDFWIAAGARGYFGLRIPKPLFLYRRHDTGIYQEVIGDFKNKFAGVVLNNRELYGNEIIAEAEKLLAGSHNELSESGPMVSVIIPTYNRPDMLADALKSVLNQTYRNYEIIVVNDGEVDVENIVSNLNQKGNIAYVRHNKNKGVSAARNTGIKIAKGKYIALLDDDDIFYSNHLETAIKYLNDKNPVIYTDAVRAMFTNCGDAYKLTGKNVPYSMDFDRNKLLIGNIAPVNCFVFDRNLAIKAGFFDEIFSTLEDWEFWLRLSALSPLKHITEKTVQVNWRTDGTTMTSSRQLEFQQNRERIYKKYQNEIKNIPNTNEILQEFNAIWASDGKVPTSFTSIIILTHNQLEYTKKCIDSIFKYTKEPFELIVVDNGSTDGTVGYLKKAKSSKLKAKSSNCCEGFKIIENKENRGFAMGNNQGMAIAKGDYVLLLNNDIVVTPGWLEKMLAKLKEEKVGIVGPRTNYVVGSQLVPKVTYSDNDMKGMGKFAERWSCEHAGKSFEIDRVIGFCMLIGRDVIEKIGGLDARFGSGNFEDDDFCLRARVAGFKIVVADDVFVHHFGSRTFIGAKIDYRCSMESNWVKFKNKWGISPGRDIKKGYIFQELLAQSFDPRKHYQLLTMDEFFNPTAKPHPISDKRSFSFLMLPDWSDGEDKWSKALLEYIKSFGPKDDVSLILRVNPERGETAEVAQEKLISLIRCAGHDPENIPDIVIVDQLLVDNERAGLYTAANVFVPTGELNEAQHLLEAKACGIEILEDVSAKHMRSVFSAKTSKKK